MNTPSEAQVVLRLDQITKRFGALVANDAISFDLRAGEVIALLGENGAGKTTLMNILFGHYTPDEGHVEVFGARLPAGTPRAALAAGVGMVHQHFTLADNMTVLENIVLGTAPLWRLGFGKAAARGRVLALMEDYGLRVDPDAQVSALSVGERQRVEILKALYREARILILDEPTAVLTPQETDDLFATMRRAVARGLSVIFISHKLHEVMAISSRVVVLRHGKLVDEARTDQVDARKLAQMMVGADVPAPKVRTAQPGPARIRLRGVSTPDRGSVPGLRGVDLELRGGQITGLAGVSGNGQGALADLLGGLVTPSAGEMYISTDETYKTAPKRAKGAVSGAGEMYISPAQTYGWSPRRAIGAGIARIPEDRHRAGTIADFDLTENAVLELYARPPFSRRGWMNWRAARDFAQGIITGYDVRCPGAETRIRLLSGGNMQKLILGRVLETTPQVVLANQPVRGLDIGALTYVHEQLLAARDRGAAVLLISEDLDEVQSLSDVIHVISEGRLSPAFDRGALSTAELGVWMAGEGFDDAA